MKQRITKRSLTLLLSLAMVFSMLIGVSGPALADSGETTINILHTNDVHGRVYQVDGNNAGMMGIDKVAAIKNATPNPILVDVGDAIHGLPIVNMNEGLNAIELMAAAGYSVMTPGNHDFNFGSARLKELADVALEDGLTIISSNVFEKESGKNFLPSTTIVEIEGIKVGFFGLTTLDTPILTSPTNVETLEFKELKASAETAIAQLKDDGAQVIVALTHVSNVDIEALIGELTDKPDAFIMGHDHFLGAETVEGVLMAGAGQYQEQVGVVSITIDADGKVTEAVASVISKEEADEIEGDEDVYALAEAKKEEVVAIYSEVVAASEVLLSSARGTNEGVLGVRNSEQALGNLVADAMRIIGGADVAVTNGGGLRADIRVGELTRGDINAVLPFGNYITIKEVTPKALYAVMEHGLQPLPAVDGRFPQISGMNVEYRLSSSGDRVLSISIDGDVLDPDDDTTAYKLATNNFTADGGDGYAMIGELTTLTELDALDDMLIEYIVKNLDGKITAEDAKIEGRIVESPSIWAVELVAAAIDAGLVPFNLQSRYNQATTRAEFTALAVVLYEMVAGEEIEGREKFEDTEDVNVEKAAAIGVVEGYGDGIFGPDDKLTREQAAVMLARLADALDFTLPAEAASFVDSDSIASWAITAVGQVQAAGIMEGVGEDTFAPKLPYERQQSIVTVLRLCEYIMAEAGEVPEAA